MANEFLRRIEDELSVARREAEQRRLRANNHPVQQANLKTIDDFRRDRKYGSDGNRVDLAYAVYALFHGKSEEQVRAAIMSRDLTHKGNDKRQADYIHRTIQKALLSCRDGGRGR
jgi:hypothetical protein